MIKLEIFIKDLKCATCEVAIDSRFKKLGIISSTSFVDEKVIVEYDETKWSQEDVLNNIKVLGYTPSLKYEYKKTKEDYLEILELSISFVFTIFFIWNMFQHAGWVKYSPEFMKNGWVQFTMASFIQLYVGRRFYKQAFYQIKNKKYGMETLVAMSTTLAYLYSAYKLFRYGPIMVQGKDFFFDVSAEVITFLLIGKIIESAVKRRATNKLKELVQEEVRKITLSNGEIKNSDELKKGDEYIIQLGQRVYADSIIIEGQSTIDESSLTGESTPIIKKIGDLVLSGTINTSAPIKVRVLKDSNDSKIQQLNESIQNLQKNKSKISKLVDRISHYFVPVVFYIVILTLLAWSVILKKPFESALYNAIAVAVVACPCALGLATPMSVVTGASIAIQKDILYNKADVFEKFKDVNVVAFDKTGTVTMGELHIDKIIGDKSLIDHFISLEIISMHPIAKAFMTFADSNDRQKNIEFDQYNEEAGKGVSGINQGSKYMIGSYDYILKHNTISSSLKAEYQKGLKDGYVTILGAKDGVVTSIFALKDKIKKSTREAIDKLHAQGIKTVMITGDNKITASFVAKQVGIDEFYANTQPLEKPQIIKKLQQQGHIVAFAGDGVNDGAALTQADLSIVMGSGSDLAKSVSDITLLNSDLSSILKALVISNQTLRNIKSNLWFAFIWNTTMIPLAAFGYLQPWIAAMVMSVESLAIILKSQLLRFIKFDD